MSALHAALKALGPVDFTDVPTDPAQLNEYVLDLFTQSQLILESIPIGNPDATDSEDRKSVVATSAAEIKPSLARSAPPIEEYASLQKEWGKPIKLGAKENALGMSVYKTSGKDGKGAWFARRSVHEGLGFSKFKSSMEQEFEESLAVHGSPGEGNIRGIGGEERVESIDVPGRGKMEVYRLSAQFPGPTTPRDFVTLLITSDNAMKPGNEPQGVVPKHYMVISKPCNHPDTQPQSGFIRGSYESVEFIREVPRKLKTSMSTTDLEATKTHGDDDISKAAIVRSAQQTESNRLMGERRKTAPQHPSKGIDPAETEGNEVNPVEWIMVTRSDPGGSVPRFMVERGTPGSICQDASKFLDWACQPGEEEAVTEESNSTPNEPRRPSIRRDSFQSFRSSRLAGLENASTDNENAIASEDGTRTPTKDDHATSGGIIGAVAGAVSAYTPQVVLDHLPGHPVDTANKVEREKKEQPDDAKSILSTTSFQSAEDHISSDESDVRSELSKTSINTKEKDHNEDSDDRPHSQHEKELQKLEQRRIALESKFADSRSKLDAQVSESAAKEESAQKKALEKHEKEIKKHEEKYRKEMQKLEDRQRKERAKLEDKGKKQQDKNEQARLRRERDDARRDAELARKETALLRDVVADLQRENTALVAKLGKIGGGKVVDEVKADVAGDSSPRRSESSRRVTINSNHSNLSQGSSIEQAAKESIESASLKSEKT